MMCHNFSLSKPLYNFYLTTFHFGISTEQSLWDKVSTCWRFTGERFLVHKIFVTGKTEAASDLSSSERTQLFGKS